MKLTISIFFKVYIYILIAMNVSITKIFSSIQLLSYPPYIRFFTGLSAIFLMLICLVNSHIRRTIKPYLRSLNIITAVVIIMYVVEMFYTMNKYGSTFMETLYVLDSYWFLFLIYPLIYLLSNSKKEDSLQSFIKGIIAFTMIALIIRLIIAVSYNFFGLSIWTNIRSEYAIEGYSRYGRIRINTCCFGLIWIAFLLYLYFVKENKKYRKTWILLVGFAVFYSEYVNLSRANLLGQIAAIILVILFMKNPGEKKLVIWSTFFLVAIVVLNLPTMQQFITGFSPTNAQFGSSTSDRLLSHEYYLKLFRYNPYLGIGALFPGNKYQLQILDGVIGRHISYLEDLGGFASIYMFGLFAILLYGIYYYNLIKGILICKKNKTQQAKDNLILLIGMLAVSIVAFFSTDFFMEMSIFSMPFNYVILIYVKVSMCKKTEMLS